MEAVVMDCNGKNAVLLKEDGTFVTVKDASYTIGQKIETVAMKRTGIGHLAAAACLCLVIGLGGVGAKMWFTPYAHVEVCADYSAGLTLNRFRYVIDAEVESDDNAVLTEEFSQEVKNKKVSDAVRDTISHTSEKEKAQVNVTSPDEKGQKKIREQIAQSIGNESINIEESETTQVQASNKLLQAEIIFTDAETEVPMEDESVIEVSTAEEPVEEVPISEQEELELEESVTETTEQEEMMMEDSELNEAESEESMEEATALEDELVACMSQESEELRENNEVSEESDVMVDSGSLETEEK